MSRDGDLRVARGHARHQGPPDRCPRPAAYKRWWPGREPDTVCLKHGDDSVRVANAMGFDVPIELLDAETAKLSRCACSPGFSQTVVTGG